MIKREESQGLETQGTKRDIEEALYLLFLLNELVFFLIK
jgi:hypothetical protein